MIYRAQQDGLLLLAADKDFGELIFRPRCHVAGIVLMRISGLSEDMKSEMVVAAARDHELNLTGAFMVITSDIIRIRHINQRKHEN